MIHLKSIQLKNKNILILGASLLQKPAIQSAKELGCKVFVVDANPNALCVSLADVFECIDLKDEQGLLSYAKKFIILKVCMEFLPLVQIFQNQWLLLQKTLI